MIDRRHVLKLVAAAAVIVRWPLRVRAVDVPAQADAALRTASLIYVATRRRNGQRSSIRPIWFYYEDGRVFFTTSPTSWKAKRIAKGSPLYIWVGSEDGPFVLGHAEAVTDPALIDRMGDAYARKYWLAWMGLFRPRSDRVSAGKTKAYLVTLSHGEPPA